MVSQEVLDDAVEVADSWYPAPARIDWEDLLYRVECRTGVDLPVEMTHPDIMKIKLHVRLSRKDGA